MQDSNEVTFNCSIKRFTQLRKWVVINYAILYLLIFQLKLR